MRRYGLIGAAGYIAPRHIQAIRETGGKLIAACDPHESVGILDRYDKSVAYFRHLEEFNFFLGAHSESPVDYVSVCSPNYLHAAHIKAGLDLGAHVICEKPLVLKTRDLDYIDRLEIETGKTVYSILQLRAHEAIRSLHDRYVDSQEKHAVDLCYITSRGPWYHQTWKADVSKSGGVACNIGVHFFDMLHWVFGEIEHLELHLATPSTMAGYLELERAQVRWFLSIDEHFLPNKNASTFRSITIDDQEVEFSQGFADLHTKVYQEILDGRGYRNQDAASALKVVERLQSCDAHPGSIEKRHPILKTL